MFLDRGVFSISKIFDNLRLFLIGTDFGDLQERRLAIVRSPWSKPVLAEIETLPPDQKEAAHAALMLAADAGDQSKPTLKFLKKARALLSRDPGLETRILQWIETHTPDPAHRDRNQDVIRGLIWMLACSEREDIASRLGNYGELCFRKIPNLGARSAKLGNAALQALGAMSGSVATVELTRLKKKVRYPSAKAIAEGALSNVATRMGVSREDLDEISLPTFDLSSGGERRVPVGDGFAILRLRGSSAQLSWMRAHGRETTSVPKSLKDAAPDAVKSARDLQKQIEGALAGQIARIEGQYLSGRRLDFATWRARYLEHPLIAGLTRRLIWRFEASGQTMTGIPRGDIIDDASGNGIGPSPQSTVSLWHPLYSEADDVRAWRERLATLQITQPFKQAHREIYIITDAERETETYSNRFAAHILRQHQFKALCDQRGWRYQLMGEWDSYNVPTKEFPDLGLSVEYDVDSAMEGPHTDAGIFTTVTTDRVCFYGARRTAVLLGDIPRLVFSEIMRDVDLFVGVSSIATDPTWVDRGPDPPFADYWREQAFGELGQTAQTRAEVLRALVPRLAISSQCRVTERYLIVEGHLHTYKIHLGSANILMEPNNRYLCIVGSGRGITPSLDREVVALPFEGDSILSLILSKAFLLAADDKITDRTILRQIRG